MGWAWTLGAQMGGGPTSPVQPSPAQGCEAETQAGSWKSRHRRATGLLGLNMGVRRESGGTALPQWDRWSPCLLDSQGGCPD